MIDEHISKAKYNERFVADCEEKFPGDYFDWKITANFYCALHLFRAFLKKRGYTEDIQSHDQLVALFNTKRNGGKPPVQIKDHVWQSYSDLRRISEAARYGKIANGELEIAMLQEEFILSCKKLSAIKKYFSGFGVTTDQIEAA